MNCKILVRTGLKLSSLICLAALYNNSTYAESSTWHLGEKIKLEGEIKYVSKQNSGGVFRALTAADWDGDGLIDLIIQDQVVQNRDMCIRWCKNIGTKTAPKFSKEIILLEKIRYGDNIFAADWNSDGIMDIVVMGSKNSIALNTGTPDIPKFEFKTISTKESYSFSMDGSKTICYSAKFMDWDGDGKKDVLSGIAHFKKILLYRNIGSDKEPLLDNPVEIDVGMQDLKNNLDIAPHFIDVEGDGDIDILLTDYGRSVLLCENIAEKGKPAVFAKPMIVKNASGKPVKTVSPRGIGGWIFSAVVSTEDFNSDGIADLIWVGASDTEDQVIWFGPGNIK